MRNLAGGLLIFLLFAFVEAASLPATERIRSYLEGLDAGDAPAIAGETLNEPGLRSS